MKLSVFLIICFGLILEYMNSQACSGGNVCGDGYCCKYSSGCECSHVVCHEMCFHGDSMPNDMHPLAKPGMYDNRMINTPILSTSGDITDHLADPDPFAAHFPDHLFAGPNKKKRGEGEGVGDGEEESTEGDGTEESRLRRRLIMLHRRKNPVFYRQKSRKNSLQKRRKFSHNRQSRLLSGVNVIPIFLK